VKGGKNYRVTLRPHIYPIISFLDEEAIDSANVNKESEELANLLKGKMNIEEHD
jgi:hypothetical protein